MDTLVRYEVDGAVARLTLDSPHNRNALSTRWSNNCTRVSPAPRGNPASAWWSWGTPAEHSAREPISVRQPDATLRISPSTGRAR